MDVTSFQNLKIKNERITRTAEQSKGEKAEISKASMPCNDQVRKALEGA